ncbi:hypothetical protein HS7_13080 [Sulfolobales archaeon HS-7]|nr:hypothetical protein HS7_13080 [Sulfolobales archaeon HS-7]
MRCVYCDHILPKEATTYGSGRCDFCGNTNNWGNAFLYFRIRNLLRGCDQIHDLTGWSSEGCVLSTALDFTDVGVVNFKPQVSSFYEALVRCRSTGGILHTKYVCDELFREDIFIEKMGVFVNIPEKRGLPSHDNTRVAVIDRSEIKIYDGDRSTVQVFKGGKKEDDKNLYSRFALIPYDKIKRIEIKSHETYTYLTFSTKFSSPADPILGWMINIPVNRVVELFRGTPAENLIKVK